MDFVKKFDDELTRAIASRKPGVTVWRDKKELRNGDVFNKEIEASVRSAGFFVAVITGAWETSEACQKELKSFLEDSSHEGLFTCAILAAGAKVNLPKELKNAEYTKFYSSKDGQNTQIATNTKTFRDSVAKLADDICDKLIDAPSPITAKALVARFRSAVKVRITAECGTMRILGMSAPVPIDGIYTDVHILEKPTRDFSLDPAKIGHENFREFGRGQRREERLDSKKALERFKHLMILGPPGAGKTTFLRRLAMECLNETFLADSVPFFLSLKEYSGRQGAPNLIACLDQLAKESVQPVLQAGYALILLDGLDEVAEAYIIRVRQDIDACTKDYPNCTIIVTCRNQANHYVFEKLTEIEMADFTPEQIRQFVTKWFAAKNLPEKINPFLEKSSPPHIREMARSPLLLTMLCLNFERNLDFASNRGSVYAEAFNTLLKECDGTRGIERRCPYQRFNVEERYKLLSEIAFHRFWCDEYIFDQSSLSAQIEDYFNSRPGLLQSGEILKSGDVLDLIESQHGILIRRSHSHYSFAHLTFQEFLTARRIHEDPTLWEDVGPLLGESRWAEVFKLTASIGDPDFVLIEIKEHIDKVAVRQVKIQEAFAWCCRKTYGLTLDSARASVLRVLYLALVSLPHLSTHLARSIPEPVSREYALDHSLAFAHDRVIDLGQTLDFGLARDIDFSLALEILEELPNSQYKKEIRLTLKALQSRLPRQTIAVWWDKQSSQWLNDYRKFLAQYRDLRFDWDWSKSEFKHLAHQIVASSLLLDCMDSAPGLTNATRDWLNQTILLPAAEIAKIPPPPRPGRRRSGPPSS